MSRSYKGMPIIKDGTLRSRRESKRLANKAVRRSQCVVNGKFYRKVHDSWNIYDYAFFRPLRRAIDEWEDAYGKWIDPDGQQVLKNQWAKWYFRK